ncbi:molecular chaperone [Cellvibrio zantedeschiae]|uniref:Molecular chaperone n=1 Tax=Cellvibrio zantedeschiae TaxID=1237077 RepID=A0ABQ3B4Q8_9GAMM|nr:molecular chaperone [Cellvibrio zantedeschiae]GGY79728.1 molecular chaperone [Cellvibrio zantedeschiae]
MFVGFDYGTSNCAMAYVHNGQARLIPLYGSNTFAHSTLYACERSFIAEAVWQQLPQGEDKLLFAKSRSALLSQSRAGKQEHSIANVRDGLFFGQDAIDHYIAAPSEGYFIKSPKSFLGASGLRQQSVDFFEDVVAAMMLNVKIRAEEHLGQTITQAVIGRPVNFQGINAQHSNQQAQDILTAAGKRVGFREIEFLFEPLAAGFDFETRLTENKRVLVVDIGGGTTDCSMVLMGPAHIQQLDRAQDFLGHTGERVGGNDFDIQFAQKLLMPEFGINSPLSTGLPMPIMPFVNAMAINDIGAQTDFYDMKTTQLLEKLSRETTEPLLLNRFIKMREGKHNFAVVREAEGGKIALSTQSNCAIDLGFIESNLAPVCAAQDFAEVSTQLLQKISALITEAVAQAEAQPDIVYLTGGSAKSPLIQRVIRSLFGEQIAVVDGDHFGSVAAGLGVWAGRVFR